jgi:hypothetical protein
MARERSDPKKFGFNKKQKKKMQKYWSKHWEIIIAAILGLIVGGFILPKLFR